MTAIRTAAPGRSAQESAICLLRDAALALRQHPRDARATTTMNRIHAFLAAFPTHFVVEYLAKEGAGAVLHRVPLECWPDWAAALAPGYVTDQGKPVEPRIPPGFVLAYPGCPPEWQAKPEDLPDSATLVPGEGWEAIDAVQAIAELLGVPCTQEEIEEAIAELQQASPLPTPTEAMRLLWLVIREAGAPNGVVLDRHALAKTDWSRAHLEREEETASGNVRLRALLRELPDQEPQA